MSIELGKIITQAVPFIEQQLGDSYDKYDVERDFRMDGLKHVHGQPTGTHENIMPQVVANWAIPDDQFLLIECMHHDLHTRCFRFDSLSELESNILGHSSFLNPWITYIVPITHGEVRVFEVFTATGDKISKHEFDEKESMELRANCTINWLS